MISKEDKEKLRQVIKTGDCKQLVRLTAQILAKDDKALQEIAEAYLTQENKE